MTTIDIAGHLSFLIVAISLAMKDIIFLRILGICSGIVGIFYNYFVTSDPLWVPIIWLSIFIIINSSMISIFYFENKKSNLTFEDIEIWKTNFIGLSLREYKLIKKISSSEIYNIGDVLIHIGIKNKFLYFVNTGNLNVKRNNKILNTLSQGDVAGEMSFITESLPNADVIANEKSNCVTIDKTKLKSIMVKNPTLHLSITNLFNLNLTKKLA